MLARTGTIPEPPDPAGRKNMLQLVQLRWLAAAGQLATILLAEFVMGVRLPLAPMLGVVAALVALNLASIAALGHRQAATNTALFLALLLDVASLTAQLYLSGGATNPFVSLYLLQVVLGAILLDAWSSATLAGIASACFALLTLLYRPLVLPHQLAGRAAALFTAGAWMCFALIATLLVLFVTRISRNLRSRDQRLADLRQHAAEEDHIVRMGLLASGAAHALGTPLSSLAVILGDWRRMPALARDPELVGEIGEMQAEVARCKAIVTGILLSAGEARGEAPAVTTVRAFIDEIADEWRAAHPAVRMRYRNAAPDALAIVADPALAQVIRNVLDNAAEASPGGIGLAARREGAMLAITVTDEGAGFPPEMLARIGKPYASSKARPGGGLGLFLVVNVMRKLGGGVAAANRAGGGAEVTVTLPLAALGLAERRP